MTTVAYLGPAGTFTESAAVSLVSSPTPRYTSSPGEAVGLVAAGEVDLAVIAIENSVDGAVTASFDALVDAPVMIVGEVDVPIVFAIGAAATAPDARPRFATHPVAWQQVKHFVLGRWPQAEFIPASSNAAAADLVVEGTADLCAAPLQAVEQRGLTVVESGVADVAGATTRFVAIAPTGPIAAPTGNDRTAVVFSLPNEPGSLVAALTEFSSRGVDMTRIESRPTRSGLGEYVFYADLIGHVADPLVTEALRGLHRRCTRVQFLGSWPAASVLPAASVASLSEQAARDDAARTWLTSIATAHPPEVTR
ncbi:MAG: prephenate dehydratase [Corynebacterium sp.]|nr:prephenate dehydratase [Corynebacterium sp.]